MIVLLVSSKTIQARKSHFEVGTSVPLFLTEALQLHEALSSKDHTQLKKLMHISDNLAKETLLKLNQWQPVGGTPAWYTFVGDVYKGLEIEQFDESMLAFAQEHCYTISGLYGLLRPLDLIHPYRLELGYKLNSKGFKNLYEFWGNKLANHLPENEELVNLSSEEYIKSIRPHVDEKRIITPWFYQLKNGKPEFQAMHAKNARGAMARWICQERIQDSAKLVEFSEDRYTYSSSLSKPNAPTFIRDFIPVAELRKQHLS